VHEADPAGGSKTLVWNEPLCRAHCDRTRRHWCGDESPCFWDQKPCKVGLYDRQSGARKEIQSGMAAPPPGNPSARARHHIDPHPQFSPQDRYIVCTATPDGRPTAALCQLVPLCLYIGNNFTIDRI